MVTNRFKLKLGPIALCLILAAGLTPANIHPAAAAGENGDLIIVSPAPLVPPKPICRGELREYPLTVVATPGNTIVPFATVTVNGRVAGMTDIGGSEKIPYKFRNTGPFTLKIGAIKTGYGDAAPIEIQGQVIECTWNIRMWYEEAVHLTGSKDAWEAECWFKFPNQTFARDYQDNLFLTASKKTITAEYGCSTAGWVWPIKVTMNPKVQGTMEVDFSGKFTDNSLLITLSALAGALPTQVQINVQDVNLGGSPISKTWLMVPHADLIRQSGITDWKTNLAFEYRIFKTSKSLFWDVSGLTLNGGEAVFVVERNKP